MKYRSISLPKPSLGESFIGVVDTVVPDQSMSLKEILTRFTRGEPVPVGHETSHAEMDVDLEKLAHADLVERAEYRSKLDEVKKRFETQEAKRKADEKAAADKAAKAAEEKRIRIAAKKLAKQQSNTP